MRVLSILASFVADRSVMTHHALIAIVLIAGPLAAADDSLPLQKMAVDDIRVIAEGIDDFTRANNFYPGRSSRFEFVPVDSLTQDLVPDYVAVIPAFDPWGQTYWYWAAPSAASDSTIPMT